MQYETMSANSGGQWAVVGGPLMSALYENLLDLVFPPRCPGCKRRGELLCARCIERCRSLRRDIPAPTRCPHPHALLASVNGLYHYDAPLREIILKLKYGRRRRLATPLGTLLTVVPAHLHRCEVVVPVPLHRKRQQERGFNQSLLLAQAVAAALGKPINTHLERVRPTAQQVGLDQSAREANVRGAFAWRDDVTVPDVVLLIDDVLTTGSTLRECARALRAAGVREVHALALASGNS
jgi:ComF family protein